MYENATQELVGYAEKAQFIAQMDDRGSKTVGENIDWKIAQLKNEIQRLEDSKASLAPLLGMRIRDVRDAMSY